MVCVTVTVLAPSSDKDAEGKEVATEAEAKVDELEDGVGSSSHGSSSREEEDVVLLALVIFASSPPFTPDMFMVESAELSVAHTNTYHRISVSVEQLIAIKYTYRSVI